MNRPEHGPESSSFQSAGAPSGFGSAPAIFTGLMMALYARSAALQMFGDGVSDHLAGIDNLDRQKGRSQAIARVPFLALQSRGSGHLFHILGYSALHTVIAGLP